MGIFEPTAAESPDVPPASIKACGDPTKGPRKNAYQDLPLNWLPLCPRCTRLGTGECLVLQGEVKAILADKNYHARTIGADGSGISPTARRVIDNSCVRRSEIGVVIYQ